MLMMRKRRRTMGGGKVLHVVSKELLTARKKLYLQFVEYHNSPNL